MPRKRRPFHRYETNIFWNTDSCLPDNYDDSYLICASMATSFSKRGLYGPCVKAYGDTAKFPKEVRDGYYEYEGFGTFETKGSEHERLHGMLRDIVFRASAHMYRKKSVYVIIAKLSQDSEMIFKVLGSLRQRGCRVLFALPEVDVDTLSSGMTVRDKHVLFALPEVDVDTGMTVCDKRINCRIPVWLCPNLFDLECPPQPEHGDEKERYFIEPPAPDPHTIDFSMPDNVDTCVFWDVEDYPLPPGLHLSKFYDNIIAAVRDSVPSSSGGVLFYAYVVKEEEFVAHGSGIKVNVVRNAPGENFARLAKITTDFLLWSMDNPTERCYPPLSRPNLVVIRNRLENDNKLCLRSTLRDLKLSGYNIFLAQKIPRGYDDTDDLPLLTWEGLTAIGKRRRGFLSTKDDVGESEESEED